MDTDIHSCGYWCDKPACIKAQRDELRDKYITHVPETDFGNIASNTPALVLAWFMHPDASALMLKYRGAST